MNRRLQFLAAVLAAWIGVSPAAVSETFLETFGVAYDLERVAGDLESAVSLYTDIVEADAASRETVARALFRMGVCEERLGHGEKARAAWTRLARDYAEQASIASRARGELRRLSAGAQRVRIRGQVLMPDGSPASNVCVQVGTWSFEPPVITDAKGRFVVERRLRRHAVTGHQMLLIYAEHARAPLGAIQALTPPFSAEGLQIVLREMGSVKGVVRRAEALNDAEPSGVKRTVLPGARVMLAAALDPESDHVVPLEHLIPPSTAGPNGEYAIDRLVRGVEYRVDAVAEGYRPVQTARVRLEGPVHWAPDLVMREVGDRVLRGVVTDLEGRPLAADVTVFSAERRGRWLATARSDGTGHYLAAGLPLSELVLRVRATGYADRQVSGVFGDGPPIHVALTRGPFLPVLAADGLPAPDLRGSSANGTASRLVHFSGPYVLLYFWDRGLESMPPAVLADLHRRYAAVGVDVVCVHDHSGLGFELAERLRGAAIEYPVILDDYAATREPGAVSSATFALYGATGGDAFLLGPSRTVLLHGSLKNVGAALAERVREDEPSGVPATGPAVQVTTEWVHNVDSGASLEAPVPGVTPPPAIQVGKWLRRGPDGSAAPTGQVSVLRFASVYVATSFAEQYPDERSVCEQLEGIYGDRLRCTWILPSSDREDDARAFLDGRRSTSSVGIDDDQHTYRAYGVHGVTENVVIGSDGTLFATDVSDGQLFRVVKAAVLEGEGEREGGRH